MLSARPLPDWGLKAAPGPKATPFGARAGRGRRVRRPLAGAGPCTKRSTWFQARPLALQWLYRSCGLVKLGLAPKLVSSRREG